MKFLALLTVVLLAPAYAQSSYYSEQEQSQITLEAVHILGGNTNLVTRWVDDVVFAVVGTTNEEFVSKTKTVFSEISQLTGLSTRLLDHQYDQTSDYLKAIEESPDYDLTVCNSGNIRQCANFVIVLSDQKTMHQIAQKLPLRSVFQQATKSENDVTCFFSPGVSSNLQIKRSIVFIRNNIDVSLMHTCLQEEIYQSFGMFNDFDTSEYFSFNNSVERKDITQFDKALLTSLYDKHFSSGTPINKVVNHMIEHLRSDTLARTPQAITSSNYSD